MKRRHFLCLTAASLVGAGSVHAATFADDVIAQLTRQGFAAITSESTWLGRVRITAERNGGVREIVLNPRTGEILRDIWTPADGSTGQVPIVDDIGSTEGGASGTGSDSGGTGSDDNGGDSNSGGDDGGSSDDGGSGTDDGGDSGDDHGGKGKD